jgi:protease IV
MKLGVFVAACAALVACKGNDKDKPEPWGNPAAGASADDESGGGLGLGGLGGMGDPMQMLQNVVENLEKPGPYEAPESSSDFKADAAHWAVLHLGGDIIELESLDLFSPTSGTQLRVLTTRLRDLAADPNVTGVLLRVDGLGVSLPDAQELRLALAEVRAGGKKLACHTETAMNAEYLVLAACEQIGLSPLGDVVVSGPAAMPVHLKGLLAKLGVEADFLHVGAYKGAAEPLTRDAPSAEMRETIGAILDRAYATMVETIAKDRGLSTDVVEGLIDEALFTAEQARTAKLVDEVATFEQFRDEVTGGAAWTRLKVEPKDDPMASMFKLARFFGVMPAGRPHGAHVALVHAVGDVIDGSGGGTLGARGEIASATLVAALRTLTADDDVKAVVLRIDSGGGSARASELIWHAVSELAAKKPVVVSMSDVAASGGYYIAAGATKIYALDDTLTGSIGVVGGKLAPAAGLADLGITTFPMGRGKRATMMASLGTWSPDERAVVQKSMEDVYGTFLERVAAGRKMTKDAVAKIAAGRVWTGADAKKLGLVDEIGGIDAAMAEARKLGGLDDDTVVEVYPADPTLRDFVQSLGEVSLPWGLDSAFVRLAAEISPDVARVIDRTLRQLLLFRESRVLAVSIFPVVM